MPKYQCYGTVIGSKYLGEVEAPNKKAAEAMARELADVSLCHQCARECENATIEEVTVERDND